MIELRNLTKSYRGEGGRHYVFRDLSFTFPTGVSIGLIGRNGAGKSTLMRLLGGIDTADRGRVLTDRSISWPVGLSGGFQGTLTGRDNVKFVCRIHGINDAEMRDKVRFVENFAEIGDYFDQPVKSYSSGMRSRLAFGLSMAFDFDYYLIDEVMAVGDAHFKRKSKEVLHDRLTSSNVIMATHSMGEVANFCDVVVLLEGGQAKLYTDVREGIRAYQGEDRPSAVPRAGPKAHGPRPMRPPASRSGATAPDGKQRDAGEPGGQATQPVRPPAEAARRPMSPEGGIGSGETTAPADDPARHPSSERSTT